MIVALLCFATEFSAGEFDTRVRPFLEHHCLACHSGAEPKGELALDLFHDEASVVAHPSAWSDVRKRLERGEMPPAKRPRPDAQELGELVRWIDARVPRPATEPNAGGATLRRLTRGEYENSVRDLLGVDFPATVEFPADEAALGFDGIAAAMTLSETLLEKYFAAGESIAEAAVIIEDPEHPPLEHFDAGQLGGGGARYGAKGPRVLATNAETTASVHIARDGEYLLRVRAWAQQAGPEIARMALRFGGKDAQRVEVAAVEGKAEIYATRVHATKGDVKIGAAFLNDYYKADDPDPKQRDRNLVIEWVELSGPIDPPRLCAWQQRELASLDARGVEPVLAHLARRAWRARPAPHDVERLLALSKPDEAPLVRVKRAIPAILCSPRFLYRLELDLPARSGAAKRALDDDELATRLSYFVWSSLPDETLFQHADAHDLHEERVLSAELERMLRDPRASALTRNFAAQWLELGKLELVAPDPARFPTFDEDLRSAMRAETECCFEAVLREERSVWELLDADWTFVDERLARHYGIPGVRGRQMQRVVLPAGVRGGLLGQASVLTITSNPTRTSPVKRGKWILDVLLDAPPPPPPPGVGVLPGDGASTQELSMRERLDQHRRDPACASCHARLDPLGLGLENYDAIGAWREREEGKPIDASGVLPDGARFRGPAELVQLLRRDDAFVRALTKKLMVYALGRALGPDDERVLESLHEASKGRAPTVRELVRGIVLSDPFRSRRLPGAGG